MTNDLDRTVVTMSAKLIYSYLDRIKKRQYDRIDIAGIAWKNKRIQGGSHKLQKTYSNKQ